MVHRASSGNSSPNAGELDVLAVLWAEQAGQGRALRLQQIHEKVCERRAEFQDSLPALTTISTHLRALVAKNLIQEVYTKGKISQKKGSESRGMLTPPSRSPLTGYVSLVGPSETLLPTIQGIVYAYPEAQQLDSLEDVGNVIKLSDQNRERLLDIIENEKRARLASGHSQAL